MNAYQLQSAVRAAQMLMVIAPIFRGEKGLRNVAERLRGALENLVVEAVLAETAGARRAAALRLNRGATALADAIPGRVDLPKLFDVGHGLTYASARSVRKSPYADVLPVLFNGSLNALRPSRSAAGQGYQPDARAGVLKAFGSVVRNSNWQAPLLQTGQLTPAATTHVGAKLAAKHSSCVGRDALPANVAKLTGKPAPSVGAKAEAGATPAVKAKTPRNGAVPLTGFFSVHASVDRSAVLQSPAIVELLGRARTPGGTTWAAISAALDRACAPTLVEEGGLPEATALRQLTEFVVETTRILDEADNADAERATERAAALQAKTTAALKELDPSVLRALQANPDLLKNV